MTLAVIYLTVDGIMDDFDPDFAQVGHKDRPGPEPFSWRDLRSAVVEGGAAGLLIALIDLTNILPSVGETCFVYFVAGVLLGMKRCAYSLSAWPFLGGLLYVVHVFAIWAGWKQPYVERDLESAGSTLMALLPSGIGLALGALGRLANRPEVRADVERLKDMQGR
jgi:hypothetical protein